MRYSKYLAGLTLIPFAVVATSCATLKLPEISESGTGFQIEEDESQLWRSAEQIERRIDKSGILYEDERLLAYLNSIMGKLLPEGVQAAGFSPRVKVIKHPLLNAFALPHGTIYLHTGLLARMENEDQLSTVLGHELIHFTHRHTVKEVRNAENKLLFWSIFQTILTGLPAQASSVWSLTSVQGYSRELETEADERGLDLMVKAGYDVNEAPKVFQHLQRDEDEQKVKEPFFYGTHPRLQERIDNYRTLIATQYATQAQATRARRKVEEFLNRIDQLLLDNAVLDLEIGRVNTAERAIARHLKRHPQNARAHFLMGEVYRHAGRDELHRRRAIAAYQTAARLDPTHPESHRELGLLYRARERPEQARRELELYLELNPAAVDAPIIKGYLAGLEQ